MVHMVLYRLHATHRGNIDKEHTNTDTKHMHKQRKIKHGMKRKWLTRIFDVYLVIKGK